MNIVFLVVPAGDDFDGAEEETAGNGRDEGLLL